MAQTSDPASNRERGRSRDARAILSALYAIDEVGELPTAAD
ncbi:MAG TPA: hypothetical protein VGL99_27000 [Chloroflexota bacterium]|jgi:hypothetical protein